jgi:hypothetical protein
VLDADLGADLVCIRTYRAAGWCDCVPGGTGLPVKNTVFCQDHVVDPNDPDSEACLDLLGVGRAEKALEEECICAEQSGLGCKTTQKCDPIKPWVPCKYDVECAGLGTGGTDGFCISGRDGGRCHPGNFTGEQVVSLGGAMEEGDCLVYTVTGLTIVGPTEAGPDTIRCTDDDDPAVGVGARVPLTTGQARAFMLDGVAGAYAAKCTSGRVSPFADWCLEDRDCATHPGKCTGDGTVGCVEDADCEPTPGGPCDLSSPKGNGVCDDLGGTRGDVTAGPEVGTTGECVDFESSDYSPLTLVGAVPFTDSPGLGDGAYAFRFVCE